VDSGYGGSVSSRRPSQDRRRPSEATYRGRTSEDNYAPSIASMSSRRKPSQDTTRRSEDREREYGRRPSAVTSVSGNSDSTTTNAPQSTMATSGMIIPNTSTMEEEYIEVPYDREARESVSTADERERSRDRNQDALSPGFTEPEPDSASDYPSPSSPAGGLSGLHARLKSVDDDDDGDSAAGGRSGDDFYENRSYGRTSANSDRSLTGGNRFGGRASVSDDNEKLRRDYEFRIATMQTQITNLQRDLGNSQQGDRKLENSESKVRQLEEELVTFRKVSSCTSGSDFI